MSVQTGQPETDADAAIGRAAALLAKARHPVIGGLGCDVDGVRAALRLANAIGASVDHAATAHERVELRVLADSGVMTTTVSEARHRADLIVLAGPGAVAWADHARALADGGGLYPWRGERGVLCLATGGARPAHVAADGTVSALGDDLPLHRVLGLLRARLGQKPIGPLAQDGPDRTAIDAVALQMKSAAFGVMVVDANDVDHVTLDSLQGLVKDLNRDTRFTTLGVPAHHHGRGANLVSAWTTGDHLPVGLGRGYPVQDDWLHDAERLVTSGEADALLWVGALGPDVPAWASSVPTVALVHHGASASAEVVIEVGVPGVTHPGVLTDAVRDAFAFVDAKAPQPLPSVAAVITAIEAALPGGHP
ncbi:formyltransferase [Chthonobacter rhizosphaerae]|uniref:formyltransferase n=1 Tax=Chthonobacter rhizosphaerae TaxID=2735553 RepID=UPI0015EEB75E|nr:formyltransferase [Chthonobacter rhizosphaerae]